MQSQYTQSKPASGLIQASYSDQTCVCVCVCCRSASLKPQIAHSPEDALAELRELGPLGIPPSSSSYASTDPFALPLVTQAFTDAPIVPTGKHQQWIVQCCKYVNAMEQQQPLHYLG